MSKITVMDLRRTLAEYYLFLQAKYHFGSWQEEMETMEALWLAIAMRGEDILSKEKSPVHVTVSAIVMSSDHKHVLMNFHKKHSRWKHFGGHLEPGDRTLAEAAMREVEEETGLPREKFVTSPVTQIGDAYDRPLDIFAIGANGTGSAGKEGGTNIEGPHVDIDIRYLFVTSDRPDPTVSTESNDIQWVPTEKAMDLVGAEDPCNIERLLAKARAMGGEADGALHRRLFGVGPGEASGFFGKVPGRR